MKRPIFTRELWESLSLLSDISPSHHHTTGGRDAVLHAGKQAELRARVQSLRPDSIRTWGTMSVAQMMHHLSLSLGSALGYFQLFDESYGLSRTLFKWILVDCFPEQPRGLRMPLNFIIPHEQAFDFDREKTLLQDIGKSLADACRRLDAASAVWPTDL